MNDSPIRFGVLGCGVISKAHLESITRTPGAVLAAVCDSNPESLAAAMDKYGVPGFSSYEELLRQEDIDVINICTPSGMHPQQTIQAAQAKKHVIVEKPMAISLADIDPMIEACEKNGVRLATIFPRRMSESSRFAKKLIEDGVLGRLSLCTAYIKPYRAQSYYDKAGWRGTWKYDGGGVLMNQGIHTVDLLQWLVGPVVSITARAKAVLRRIEVEDTATALLEFGNGAMGMIEASTTAYKSPAHKIIIHGENGTLELTDDSITALQLVEGSVDIPEFPPFKVIPDGHQRQIEDMVKAIRENREPVVTGRDGRHSLEIILGIYESERLKKEISLSPAKEA